MGNDSQNAPRTGWILEWLLEAGIATALVYIVQCGFKTTAFVRSLVPVSFAIALVVLFALLYGRGMRRGPVRVAGYVGAGVFALVLAGVGVGLSVEENPFADLPGNLLISALIYALVPLVVYLASRSRYLVIVLFAVGSLLGACMQFLYERDVLVALVALCVLCPALAVYRNYQQGAYSVESLQSVRYGRAALSGIALGAGAGVVAVAICALVLAPLGLPTLEPKFFTEYRSLEEIDVYGAASPSDDSDNVLTSDNLTDDVRYTTNKGDLEDGEQAQAPNPSDGQEAERFAGSMFGLDLDSTDSAFDLFSYVDRTLLFAIPLAILALVVLAILVKLLLRRRRLARYSKAPPRAQAQDFYEFFLSRLEKLGLGKPVSMTAREYGKGFSRELRPFVAGKTGVTFDDLSAVYEKATFANQELSRHELGMFRSFYKAFYGNCRRYLGFWRYTLKFWQL